MKNAILQVCNMGCRRFYCGMAEGVDLWCGEILLEIKKTIEPSLEICAVIPFFDQKKSMSPQNVARYQSILDNAVLHVFIDSGFKTTAFKKRNRYMIEHADALIAVWDTENYRSGTAQTVRLAKKRNLPIFYVTP